MEIVEIKKVTIVYMADADKSSFVACGNFIFCACVLQTLVYCRILECYSMLLRKP